MLAGGWYCFSRENCDSRYNTMRRLMSSKGWPGTRTGQQLADGQSSHLAEGGAVRGSQCEVLEETLLHSLEPQRGPPSRQHLLL